jgi:hypothetical protein
MVAVTVCDGYSVLPTYGVMEKSLFGGSLDVRRLDVADLDMRPSYCGRLDVRHSIERRTDFVQSGAEAGTLSDAFPIYRYESEVIRGCSIFTRRADTV